MFNFLNSVKISRSIIAPDGKETALGTQSNCILDRFSTTIRNTWFANAFACIKCGSGTTPFKKTSASVTFSQYGSTITASAGFFVQADSPATFVFANGVEAEIIAFVDSTHVTVANSAVVSSQAGTIYYTSRITLGSRTLNFYGKTSSAAENYRTCTLETVGRETHAITRMKRTSISPVLTTAHTFTEIGYGEANDEYINGGVILDSADFVDAGYQYKVSVECVIDFGMLPLTCTSTGDYTGTVSTYLCGRFMRNIASNGSLADEGATPDFFTSAWMVNSQETSPVKTLAWTDGLINPNGTLFNGIYINWYYPEKFVYNMRVTCDPTVLGTITNILILSQHYPSQENKNRFVQINFNPPLTKDGNHSIIHNITFTLKRVWD